MSWLLIVCALFGLQNRFESGKFKGFTKSPTEHMIEDFGFTPEVRRFEGKVVTKEEDEPVEDVLVELRGPEPRDAIRGVRTNTRGMFRFPTVPEGNYTFKVTKSGFRSIVGSIRIKRSAKARRLRIEMPYGV